jgi:hypothetical protein
VAETFKIEYEGAAKYANLITGLDHNSDAVPTLVSGSFQHMSTSEDEFTTQTFQTVAKAATPVLASRMIARVEVVLNQVAVFKNNAADDESVWLVKGPDGSNANRQLINSWTRRDNKLAQGSSLGDDGPIIISTWTLDCYPLSEGLAAQHTTKTGSALSYECGTYDATSLAKGTADGRIKYMKLTAADEIARAWIGIKRGSHTGFDPIMYCADSGFENIRDSSTGASGSSTFGSIVTSTLGTADMHQRFKVAVETGQDTDLAGTYLVLWRGRYTGSGGEECRIRTSITFDLYGTVTQPMDSGHDVFIEGGSASLAIHEMGIFTFPPEGYRQERRDRDGSLTSLGLVFWIEKLAGSGVVESDAFYLIPWEHHASITECRHESGNNTWLINTEDNQLISYTYDAGAPIVVTHCQNSVHNWQYPTNQSTYWVVLAHDVGGSMASSITVELGIVPRDHGSGLD